MLTQSFSTELYLPILENSLELWYCIFYIYYLVFNSLKFIPEFVELLMEIMEMWEIESKHIAKHTNNYKMGMSFLCKYIIIIMQWYSFFIVKQERQNATLLIPVVWFINTIKYLGFVTNLMLMSMVRTF